MKYLSTAAVLLAGVALTATACSSSTKNSVGAPATTAPATTAPGATAPATGDAVSVRHTSLGTFLVDGKGQTLYLFEKDTTPNSTCTGACSSAWPPAISTGTPHAGAGVNTALLGTTMRADHTTELTYKGHPLYTFVGDHKPGDTNGEGSKAFGAGWYVVAPSGNKIDNS